ncbi:MAG: hypothetical protein U1F83_17170 [Verrucomicrobiota bacterium]
MTEPRANMVRVDADFSATPLRAKIARNNCTATRCWSSAVAPWGRDKFPCVCIPADILASI